MFKTIIKTKTIIALALAIFTITINLNTAAHANSQNQFMNKPERLFYGLNQAERQELTLYIHQHGLNKINLPLDESVNAGKAFNKDIYLKQF